MMRFFPVLLFLEAEYVTADGNSYDDDEEEEESNYAWFILTYITDKTGHKEYDSKDSDNK